MDLQNSTDHRHPVQPVILLGASNLTRDFPLILRLLKNTVDSPCDIYTAMGHGRSYGNWSRLLYRALPGISKCEIWDALPGKASENPQPLAIITDIGNDLIYGQSSDAIFGWIESCIKQLQEINARITITLLPEASISKLSSFRFELTRRLFFPNNPVSLADLKLSVRYLNEQLSELVNQNKQITIVEIPAISYGFDPIHYRYTQRSALWKSLLAEWELPEIMNQSARNRGLDFIYSFYYLQPAIKRQWGKICRKPQPARILADGTRISVY
ncbi:MAG: hypothetical protein K0U86_04640 [Planctomycetes bacterium]|nr:hypothetical protein [Planctomycetota bacterium]MCH9724175.1 hypothetical protein [Planctomycetota bacterium]MCH9778886.1 hypothetical protein [Planctomycetota bacterium]